MTVYSLCPVARTRNKLFAMCRTSQGLFRTSWKKVFVATGELEDKKLKIIGWKGPKVALKAIKDAAKLFAKKEQ